MVVIDVSREVSAGRERLAGCAKRPSSDCAGQDVQKWREEKEPGERRMYEVFKFNVHVVAKKYNHRLTPQKLPLGSALKGYINRILEELLIYQRDIMIL